MKYDKLKKACERILALEDNFKLEMDSFISIADDDVHIIVRRGESHPCGTSYCIAGILAHLDDYPEQFETFKKDGGFRYNDYIHDFLIGPDVDDNVNFYDEWLFDALWPDSLEHAKYRAQYLLDNDFKKPVLFDDHKELSLAEFKLEFPLNN